MNQVESGRSPEPEGTFVFESWADDSKGLILYIRDNGQDACDDAVVALKRAAYEVLEMETSRYLLKRIFAESSCRLVLFDIGQPLGPGFRLCRRLRAQWRGPIMIILRGVARADVMRTFKAGADMYIAAPFNPAALVVRVMLLLRRSADNISMQASG